MNVTLDGDYVEKLMREKRLNDSQLSEMLKRSNTYVYGVRKNGWITSDASLNLWAKALGVSKPDDLLIKNRKKREAQEEKEIIEAAKEKDEAESFEKALMQTLDCIITLLAQTRDRLTAIEAFQRGLWSNE